MPKSSTPKPKPDSAQKPEQPGNAPVFSCRHRALRAKVWRNETEKGPMFNTTVSRSYKEGETWHDSGSFGYNDILIVAELLRTCHGFISRELAKQDQTGKK